MVRLSITHFLIFPRFNRKQAIESISGHCSTLSDSQGLTLQEIWIDGQNANLELVSLTV